ncbi:hypothetical protein OG585_36315 [Streptomyces sp. NBC_01340]|uniref:hypothetical protein n=1 Tax=unclassified Streptomyces TaxID=2593676 RepID=UPI00225884E6|nr:MULTISPECIES: hypothetical protein [unclassified Streptomyces]MCX4458009.1 hypothetical protein [Streptomyces sp. NBC_01719]MCX4497366.1 hypothetical protein [Streptomyces sp. NBC_01728]WSI42213.1 hypothetical protein OG585_36315 [Streptomyces sp. NBC_01340]
MADHPRAGHGWRVTVFLTTQYLEEADELADRIAVLNDGKIAAEGSADELKRFISGGHVRLRFSDPGAYQSAAVALRETTRDDEALSLQIPSDGTQRELRSILDWLDSVGIEADELTVHTPDLDDVFSPCRLPGPRRRHRRLELALHPRPFALRLEHHAVIRDHDGRQVCERLHHGGVPRSANGQAKALKCLGKARPGCVRDLGFGQAGEMPRRRAAGDGATRTRGGGLR